MKHCSFLNVAFSSLILTACQNHSHQFHQDDLDPVIYQDYWAMHPVEDQYRILQFQPDGIVKIYDYRCNFRDNSYTLNGIDTVYLKANDHDRFTLLNAKQQPFSDYEIIELNDRHLKAKQFFENEHPIILNYIHQNNATPLCY